MSVVVFQEGQAVHGFHVAGRSGSTPSRSRLGGSGWVAAQLRELSSRYIASALPDWATTRRASVVASADGSSSTGTPLASAACRGFRIPLRETSTPTVGQEVSRTHASLVPRGEKDLEGFDDESVVVELGKA
jgi:hypothetical protein